MGILSQKSDTPPAVASEAWVHCIHCGMCLPTCPTYDLAQEELHSPRGRIQFIRALATGEITELTQEFQDSMHFCLGCYACESACPAGVDYSELFEHARDMIEKTRPRLFLRWMLTGIFTSQRRINLLARLLRLSFRWHLPERLVRLRIVRKRFPSLQELLPFAPSFSPQFSDTCIAPVERPPEGPITYRVALLRGCVMNVAFAEVNRQTADLLLHQGAEVHFPRKQQCCGALHGHNGYLDVARKLARWNIQAFDRSLPLDTCDAIVVNAAGCSAFMKTYGELLRDDPEMAEKAAVFSAKVRDITEWLDAIPHTPPRHPVPLKATYHDACHLAHAQGILDPPRRLLQEIPELTLIPLKESTWCCGSAGIYNVLQPETSRKLLQRKMHHIADTGAEIVITGNPGCQIQLQAGTRLFGPRIPVVHTV